MTAPVKFTPAASTKTGNQRPWEVVTSSAVRGPHSIPGIVACKLRHEQLNSDRGMSKLTEKFENRQVETKKTGNQITLRRMHDDHIANKCIEAHWRSQ